MKNMLWTVLGKQTQNVNGADLTVYFMKPQFAMASQSPPATCK